ncbi:MAG: YciI family protein [Flavobacteriales bacterium]
MKEFMLLMKGKHQLDYSPEELQKRLEAYRHWANELGERHVSAQRLKPVGAKIQGSDHVEMDGPFLEAKEIIAGFTVILAENLKDAIRIAMECPLTEHFDIFVRPLIPPGQ